MLAHKMKTNGSEATGCSHVPGGFVDLDAVESDRGGLEEAGRDQAGAILEHIR